MAQTAKPKVRIIDDTPHFISPQEEVRLQIQLLLEENEAFKARLTALESLVQTLANRPQPGQAKSHGSVVPCPANGCGQSPAQACQGEASGLAEDQSLAEKEEAELRRNRAWLDEECPFQKANGRTWRQMAENQGEKILMNGKGPQPPRAYLHSIKVWQEAKTDYRLKSKVALELCKKD